MVNYASFSRNRPLVLAQSFYYVIVKIVIKLGVFLALLYNLFFNSLIVVVALAILSQCKSRPPIRPVLKHGPRSLAYAQVIGW